MVFIAMLILDCYAKVSLNRDSHLRPLDVRADALPTELASLTEW